MNNYKTLVAEAADKYATEKGLLNGFERNSFKLVMQSPEAVELIEQIAREAQLNNCPEILIKKCQISYYHTPFNCDWWAKFMGINNGK